MRSLNPGLRCRSHSEGVTPVVLLKGISALASFRLAVALRCDPQNPVHGDNYTDNLLHEVAVCFNQRKLSVWVHYVEIIALSCR